MAKDKPGWAIWNDFITLKNGNAIRSLSAIKSWRLCRLTEIDLKCWETDILINLDLIYRRLSTMADDVARLSIVIDRLALLGQLTSLRRFSKSIW